MLCRTHWQTDSKTNITLKAINLTQTSVGSRKSDTKLEKTERVFKNFSGKKKKQSV